MKKSKVNISDLVFDGVILILLLLFTIMCLYPMIHILMCSFSDGNELLAHTGLMLRPLKFTTAAYKAAFDYPQIVSGYLNTLLYVTGGTLINLALTILGAYFLSRKNVLFRDFIMGLILLTMYFSGGLVPIYLNVKDLGLNNTYWAMVLPNAINTFNLIITRTYFASLPDSLEESARLDGAGHLSILIRIILPLTGPIIAVISLYYAVAHWNSWFNAMIYLKDGERYPLQLVLREIIMKNEINNGSGMNLSDQTLISESIKYAVIIIATVPILCIYPFLQKFFVNGIMIGAVKG